MGWIHETTPYSVDRQHKAAFVTCTTQKHTQKLCKIHEKHVKIAEAREAPISTKITENTQNHAKAHEKTCF